MANMETKTETLRRRRDFSAAVISTAASWVAVRVIPTDEDLMIARSVRRILETEAVNEP